MFCKGDLVQITNDFYIYGSPTLGFCERAVARLTNRHVGQSGEFFKFFRSINKDDIALIIGVEGFWAKIYHNGDIGLYPIDCLRIIG